MKVSLSNVLTLKQLGIGERCLAIENLHQEDMAKCIGALKQVNKIEAQKIAEKVGGQIVDFDVSEATEWSIMMEPLRDLKIIFALQRYNPEFADEILTFYGKETKHLGLTIEDLYDFTRLCTNALVLASNKPCK